MSTPGGPRQGNFPPNYNPNALANSMENLQTNQSNQQQSGNFGGSVYKLPNATPFGQQPPRFSGSRPGPPPPGVFSGGQAPPTGPAQTTFFPSPVPDRPTGPPAVTRPASFASRPPPPGALPSSIGGPATSASSGLGPRPGPFPSSPLTSRPALPPHMVTSGPVSNGSPSFTPGLSQGGPHLPPAISSMPRPFVEPPQPPTMLSSGPSSQTLQMRPSFGARPSGASSAIGQSAPPFSAPSQSMIPPPGSLPFSAPQGMLQSSGSPYGMQTWPPQPQQVAPPPPVSGHMQQPQMFGMPPGPPPLPNQSMALNQTAQSKIDPNQIPRLTSSSTVILHETRQGNQANPPPPATSDYIVTDTGNCSPRYMRCTINQIPCNVDLLSTSGMQLALLVQPLALPNPSEEAIQVM